jgi:hypothetical protein
MRASWKKCVLIFFAQFLLCVFPAALKAQVSANCTGGLSLKLSAPESAQGTLLRVALGNSGDLTEVKGEWGGKDVSFWQDAAHANIRRAFLGVDLEMAPGASKFVVTAKRENGESVGCTADVTVKAGHFVVEKLSVDEKFVRPNPEDEARAEKESQRNLRHAHARKILERPVPLSGGGAAPGNQFRYAAHFERRSAVAAQRS